MSGAARNGDMAKATGVSFGAPCCPHNVIGPITQGALTVFINGKPAAREYDHGVHAQSCGPNTFMVLKGSTTVIIEGYAAARIGDDTIHDGQKIGKIDQGSPNVFIGG